MKKTLLTTALISGAVLGLGAMNSVSAADTDTAVSKNTSASATFTAGGTDPTDPTNPNKGPLSITNITPGIDFGSHPISATTESYSAEKNDLNVTVSDLRGNFKGWNVSVSGTPLKSTETTEPLAASLTLPVGGVTAVDASTDVTGVTADNSKADVLGGTSVAISADKDHGTGSISTNYKKDDIKLTVVGSKAHATSYTTTLTWSLTDGPKA